MITKSNLTLTVNTKVLEKFNQVKGNTKVSHLVQNCLSEFIENKKRIVPKNNPPVKRLSENKPTIPEKGKEVVI